MDGAEKTAGGGSLTERRRVLEPARTGPRPCSPSSWGRQLHPELCSCGEGAGWWAGPGLWVSPTGYGLLQGSGQQTRGQPQARAPGVAGAAVGARGSGGRLGRGPSLPLQQQGRAGGGGQQGDGVVVPGLSHVHPIDLQECSPSDSARKRGLWVLGSSLPYSRKGPRSPTCRVPARWAAPLSDAGDEDALKGMTSGVRRLARPAPHPAPGPGPGPSLTPSPALGVWSLSHLQC